MGFSSERMGSSAGETEEIGSRVQGAGRQDGGQAGRLYISPHAVNTHLWAALTDPDQTAAYLYGLAAHSSWVPGDPIEFRVGGRAAAIGQVLHARRQERLSYLLRAGPGNPPVYLTWLLRSALGGWTVRLEIDQADHADSLRDAEDVWLPVLGGLQLSVSQA